MTLHMPLDAARLQKALALLPTEAQAHFIGGKSVPGESGETIVRESPAHGVPVSRVCAGTAGDARRAVAVAHEAFLSGRWPRTPGVERARVLLRMADLIERDREILATMDALEAGKPIAQARDEISGAADIWRYAAGLARHIAGESYSNLGAERLGLVLREPVGVVGIVTPWNFPFLIVSQKLPFALAAGCTAVVKPSEMTSSSTLHGARLLAEAGLPDGAANVVTGTGPAVGRVLTQDPRIDMVSFTGSTAVGKAVMAAAAETLKKVSMELGGKNPQIVFADADLEAAVDAAAFGAWFNAGECCNAGSRLILHRDVAADFVAILAERARSVPLGDPLDARTRVGALVSAAHRDKVLRAVEDARDGGAAIRAGGAAIDGPGFFVPPTVIDGVAPDMAAAREEIFGPVVSVLTFETAPEAIVLANSTAYGLSAGVWSRDIDTVMAVGRGVRAGTVWANTFMDGAPELPFGGYGQSGLGRELGRNAALDYTEEKTFHIRTGPRTAWWSVDPTGRG